MTTIAQMSDESLVKLLRMIQDHDGIRINQLIGDLDISNAYITVGLKELRDMGCIVPEKGEMQRVTYYATNHNCYYCKG